VAKSIRSERHRALLAVLVACRREAGLTQRDLAAKMKKSPSTIAQIESGQRQVYAVELYDFAKAFGIEPAELTRRWMSW
jgi:transcriptional regulator with XRE-family HTH domain